LLATRQTSDEKEIEDCGLVSWQDTFEMLECCGCETVMLRHSHWFSENYPDVTVSYYPPAVSRRRPAWQSQLPLELCSLMREVYSALDANNRRLALMGARTAFDMVLVDKVGDQGTFAKRLEKLEQQGFVGRRNREFLLTALEAGSAAAHRGFQPQPEHLGHVMDIVENVLQAVYALEDGATQVKKATPARAGNPPDGGK
jgi:hypothetical protein